MNENMNDFAERGDAGRGDEADGYLGAYGASMRQVGAPAAVRAELVEKIAERRAHGRAAAGAAPGAEGQPARPGRQARLRRPRALRHRWALAAAGAAALVLAGGAAVSHGGFGGLAGPGPGAVPDVPTAAAPAEGGNFFVLKAWADETPEGAALTPGVGELVGIDWLHPAFVTSWDTWEGDTVFGDLLGPGEGLAYFEFDSLCEGENLASVTYEIDNPNAFFEYFDWRDVDALAAAGGDTLDAVEMGSSFTLTYGEGGSAETAHTRLYVIAPLADEYDENPHAVEAYAEAARVLDGTELALTAAFNDGTTQKKVYRIAMVDDFNEQCAAFLKEYFAAWDVAGPQGEEPRLDSPDTPKLFTLTLVSES